MKIFDLFVKEPSETALNSVWSSETDYADNILTDATLLDLLHYSLYSVTAILVDLRTSVYFHNQNTGVIVFREVSDVVLNDNFNRTLRPALVWILGDISLTSTDQKLELNLPLTEASIKVVAKKIEFYIGNADNIGEIATSLDEGIDSYIQTTPHWESDFEIIAASKWGGH